MTTAKQQASLEAAPSSRDVEISKEPVELFKILKFEGLVASGGLAKTAIAAGEVLVNGETEKRKRRQIRSGDTIVFNGERLVIRLESTAMRFAEADHENE